MTLAPFGGLLPAGVGGRYPFGYAVVDVETSGLSPSFHRVLQIAVVQIRSDGATESTWSTLLNPGCDPGPVHIHGLTKQRLAGAPLFADVANQLAALVAGRVLVAHNARFDWDFLAAEAGRASIGLAVTHRLCTMALTRRLDVPLGSLTLGSVAAYWGVRQYAAHDAEDDTRVLVEILRHELVLANRLGLPLPLTSCSATASKPVFPTAAPRPPCPWRYPGRWTVGTPLRQGMKLVITGDTRKPRDVLVREATEAGLDVMNSVSSRTSLALCNEVNLDTRKAQLVRQHGTPIVTEAEFLGLLPNASAGDAKATEVPTTVVVQKVRPPPVHQTQTGPLAGRRVLILGGSHDDAAALRQRVLELGGQGAANLTASVTDVVALQGCERDPRWERICELGFVHLDAETLQPREQDTAGSKTAASTPAAHLLVAAVDGASSPTVEPVVLPRGGVTDLPAEFSEWMLSVSWPDQQPMVDIDVVTFIVDADEQVAGDQDFCFYNNPTHATGSVELELDTPGEVVATIRLDALPAGQRRIVIAAVIDGEVTFGDVGPIELILRTAEGLPVVRATLDAATRERSLILGNLYDRNGTWRFRAVGQGYRSGLPALAVLHGVDIEED